MNGPLALTHPNATPLELMAAAKEPLDPKDLPNFIALAKDAQPLRLKRIAEEETAFATERQLAETKGTVTELLTRCTAEWQQGLIHSLDEVIDNPASDTKGLSEQLRPLEYHVSFLSDTKDRIEIRIAEARISRLTATVERCKSDAFEADLLAVISRLKTDTAMAEIRQKEGGAIVFGVRSQQLKAAAEEKHRLVGLAEAALRDEVTRQRTIAEHAIATGAITRAQLATVVS